MNLFHGYICFYLFHLQQSTHSQCQILARWSTFPKYLYILAQRKYIYIYIYIYPNSESTIFNLIPYTISEISFNSYLHDIILSFFFIFYYVFIHSSSGFLHYYKQYGATGTRHDPSVEPMVQYVQWKETPKL